MATVTPHSLTLHRVPAALLRARTRRESPIPGGWAAAVVRLLHVVAPVDVWNNPAVWPMWQQLLPHVLASTDPVRPLDQVPDQVSWLLGQAASYRHTRGEPRAALPLFARAHSLDRTRLGDDHPDTLGSANNLAQGLRALGEYQQARTLDEDTLTRRRRVLTGAAPQPDEACLAGSVGGLRSGGDRVSKDRLWAALWRWLAAVSRPPDRSPL
jgi:hypothetical protein